MSPIIIHNGKILIKDGKIATSTDCCCNACTDYVDGCYDFTCTWSLDYEFNRSDPCCATGYTGTVCDGFPWTVNDYLAGCPNQCIDAGGTDTQTFTASGSFSGTFEVSGNQTLVTWNIDDIDGTPVSSTDIFWDPNNVQTIGVGDPPTTCDGDFQCGTEYGGMGYCMTIGIYFTGSLCVTCSADGLAYPGGGGMYNTSCGISTNITYGNHTNSYSSSGDSSIDNEWQEATYPYCNEPIDPLIQCDCDNRESCLLAYSSDSTATWNISFSATPTTCP